MMRARCVPGLAALAAVLLFAVVADASRQTAPAGPLPRTEGRAPLRVVVDGRSHPELIPDRVAVAIFLSAIALPGDADRQTVASMEARVKRMDLSRSDMGVLRGELAGLHARLRVQQDVIAAAFADARAQRTPEMQSRAAAAQEGRYALTWDSYTRLLETLSPAGAKRLVAQIARVKAQTKAVGPSGR